MSHATQSNTFQCPNVNYSLEDRKEVLTDSISQLNTAPVSQQTPSSSAMKRVSCMDCNLKSGRCGNRCARQKEDIYAPLRDPSLFRASFTFDATRKNEEETTENSSLTLNDQPPQQVTMLSCAITAVINCMIACANTAGMPLEETDRELGFWMVRINRAMQISLELFTKKSNHSKEELEDACRLLRVLIGTFFSEIKDLPMSNLIGQVEQILVNNNMPPDVLSKEQLNECRKNNSNKEALPPDCFMSKGGHVYKFGVDIEDLHMLVHYGAVALQEQFPDYEIACSTRTELAPCVFYFERSKNIDFITNMLDDMRKTGGVIGNVSAARLHDGNWSENVQNYHTNRLPTPDWGHVVYIKPNKNDSNKIDIAESSPIKYPNINANPIFSHELQESLAFRGYVVPTISITKRDPTPTKETTTLHLNYSNTLHDSGCNMSVCKKKV